MTPLGFWDYATIFASAVWAMLGTSEKCFSSPYNPWEAIGYFAVSFAAYTVIGLLCLVACRGVAEKIKYRDDPLEGYR